MRKMRIFVVKYLIFAHFTHLNAYFGGESLEKCAFSLGILEKCAFSLGFLEKCAFSIGFVQKIRILGGILES